MGVFLMSVAKSGALAGAAVALGISFAGLPVIGIAAADSADTATSQGSDAGAATTGSTTASKGQRQGGKPRTGASARAASPTDTVASAPETSDGAASTVGGSLRSAASDTAASDTAGSGPSASRESVANPRSAHRSRPGPVTGQSEADSPVVGSADVETPAGSPDQQHSAAVDTVADSNAGADVVSGAATADSQARPVAAATTARVAAFRVPSASAVTDIFSGILGSIQGFFEGALLLVRRAFFNQAPTVDPVQLTGQSEGLITGTIGPFDPEGEGIS